MSNNYAHWHADLKKPDYNNRDTDQPTDGFWRIHGDKTKPDYPVAIWHDGDGFEMIKIGRKDATQDAAEIEEFRASSWLKCLAVPQVEYDSAIDTGFWPDTKPSRKMSEEERLGIRTEPGGNNVAR